jgi:STE24 endopeptidase
MVTGPCRFLRYVVLTDRLIEELSTEEIEAVFGHEVGHVKHQHMLFYIGFLLSSLVVLTTVCAGFKSDFVQSFLELNVPGLRDWMNHNEALGAVFFVALLATYIVIVFGFISRRCERQADIFGCRTVSCQTFIDALEKVARLNGINRERPGWVSSWQHSTVALRVAFLQRMSADPEVEPRFQRRVGLVKWGFVLGLLGLVALLFALSPDQLVEAFKKL